MSRPKPPSQRTDVLGEPVALGATSSSGTAQTGGAPVLHSACGPPGFPCGFLLQCLQLFFFADPLGFPCVLNLTPANACSFLILSSHSRCFSCSCLNYVSIFRNVFSSSSSLDSNLFRYLFAMAAANRCTISASVCFGSSLRGHRSFCLT